MIDAKTISTIDLSFRCRGEGSGAQQPIQMQRAPPVVSFGENMMQTFMQTMLQQLMSNQIGEKRLELSGNFCPPSGRHPAALKNLCFSPARVPLSIGDAQRPATPAHEGRAEVPALPAFVAAEAASSVAAHAAASVAAATVPVTVAETPPSKVPFELLAALDARDAQRKEEKKEVTANKRAASASATEPKAKAAKQGTNRKVETETQNAAKATSKQRGKEEQLPAKVAAEKVQKAAKSAKSPQKFAAKYGLERSRNQVMCRTGLGGPGSTLAMKWGSGQQFATEALAVAAAKKWLKNYSGS